ncbi:PHA/PHB synthase family protein [Actimicrobium antarcticum]|uniref:Alpha/beta fold hydrolase n=1 Tax=Actimicrobium antarcticum TaxID=1051899 RepID=A0ABP7SS59_9BURK
MKPTALQERMDAPRSTSGNQSDVKSGPHVVAAARPDAQLNMVNRPADDAATGQRDMAKAIDRAFHTQLAKFSMGFSPISLSLAYADWAMHLALSPGHQMYLAQQAIDLTRGVLSGAPQAPSGIQSTVEKDRRFSDPAWNTWPFSVMKDSFKAGNTWWDDAVRIEGMSRHHGDLVKFFTRQKLDALSPSNWPNSPEVLRKGEQSSGQSWIKGYQSYASDVLEYQQAHSLGGAAMPKALEFEVGKDVALTPGKVVFRNHLIELIQYTATTAKVYPEPLLIVPSCIMKYYILDLSLANSMVRYLVAQGHTVFMVSWRNPDASDRDLGVQDYLRMGIMDAMAAVKTQTGAARINALGYCLGGTYLAIVAAALGGANAQEESLLRGRHPQAPDEKPDRLPELATVTLLAAQTDFSEPGELGIFIDDDQLNNLREMMARTGFLSGRQMAGSFQFLNSRDLIWSRNTRRYLLGQDEVGSDMMSWNADVTRLPERMHNEYLSSLFLNNDLASGHYRVGGVGVALKDIKAPMLIVGTARDHVSPWRSVYKIRLLTDAESTFILAAGGHNAGIVSEPGHPDRSYQMDSPAQVQGQGQDWIAPDDWAAAAPLHEGSWWEAMQGWLHERSGKPVPARVIAPEADLGNAPGGYAMVRYED